MGTYQFYLILKSFHVIFMVAWFAGLFYLPRLLVYHCETIDSNGKTLDHLGNERFKIMERRLLRQITTPAALLTVISGLLLISIQGIAWLINSTWMHLKIVMILGLIGYHAYISYQVHLFKHEKNDKTSTFYKVINELPVIALIVIVLLAIIKPN